MNHYKTAFVYDWFDDRWSPNADRYLLNSDKEGSLIIKFMCTLKRLGFCEMVSTTPFNHGEAFELRAYWKLKDR